MKKFIASLLAMAISVGSLNNITFADNNTVKKETVITLKEELSKDELQPKPDELTKEERQAAKLVEQFKEKLNDSYGDIMSKNPCMKTAFTEVQAFLAIPFTRGTRAVIEDKIYKLEAEEDSLVNYRKTILESPNVNEEDTKKQLKNIENRLQAITYTKNCLKTYLAKKNKEALPVLILVWASVILITGFYGFLLYNC